MTIQEAILWGYEQLTPTSDSARVDAELLLASTLRKSTTFLFTHDKEPLDLFSVFPFYRWKFKRLIQKRRQGIPVAYLVGHKEFYLLDFKVNRHVLVPRPDTEILAECVVSYLNDQFPISNFQSSPNSAIPNSKQIRNAKSEMRNLVLVDVGTGSGCIPISVLKNVPGLRAIGTDISWRALRVAKTNARKHHVEDRLQLIWSDLLENIDVTELEDSEVILTANLPYLPDKMEVKPELTFEPSISLYGGSDGMDVYRRLMRQVHELRPKAIFLELYEWQIALIQAQFPGYELKFVKTMSGDARCLMLERK
jgi:release factor glutamine methyltransferase